MITFSRPSSTFKQLRIPGTWASGWMNWPAEPPVKMSSTSKSCTRPTSGRPWRWPRTWDRSTRTLILPSCASNCSTQGLQKYLPAMRAEFEEGERQRHELEHCGTTGATPACNLQVRFLYQVLRALPSSAVFIQLLCGFELASSDPLVVGINMVQPEDWRVSPGQLSAADADGPGAARPLSQGAHHPARR